MYLGIVFRISQQNWFKNSKKIAINLSVPGLITLSILQSQQNKILVMTTINNVSVCRGNVHDQFVLRSNKAKCAIESNFSNTFFCYFRRINLLWICINFFKWFLGKRKFAWTTCAKIRAPESHCIWWSVIVQPLTLTLVLRPMIVANFVALTLTWWVAFEAFEIEIS